MRYQVIKDLRIKTPTGEREFHPGQVITLPEDKATSLIEAGKVKEVSGAILWDTLSKLYLATLEQIGRAYPGPAIWDNSGVREAEDRLNEVWLASMRGEAILEDFKSALAVWEGLITSKGMPSDKRGKYE